MFFPSSATTSTTSKKRTTEDIFKRALELLRAPANTPETIKESLKEAIRSKAEKSAQSKTFLGICTSLQAMSRASTDPTHAELARLLTQLKTDYEAQQKPLLQQVPSGRMALPVPPPVIAVTRMDAAHAPALSAASVPVAERPRMPESLSFLFRCLGSREFPSQEIKHWLERPDASGLSHDDRLTHNIRLCLQELCSYRPKDPAAQKGYRQRHVKFLKTIDVLYPGAIGSKIPFYALGLIPGVEKRPRVKIVRPSGETVYKPTLRTRDNRVVLVDNRQDLGSGSFGRVRTGRKLPLPNVEPRIAQEVAVKKVVCESLADYLTAVKEYSIPFQIMALVPTAKVLVPEGIVAYGDGKQKYDGAYPRPVKNLQMVMPKCWGTVLDAFVYSSLTVSDKLYYFQELAQGMADVHHAGVVLNDFKSENTLIMENGTVVLSDFGLAFVQQEGFFASGMTPNMAGGSYPSPEAIYLRQSDYKKREGSFDQDYANRVLENMFPGDIFAFGCGLADSLGIPFYVNHILFQSEGGDAHYDAAYMSVFNALHQKTASTDPYERRLARLALRMIDYNFEKRPSIAEVQEALRHIL